MANNESKKLTVDVLARVDKLERGMAKAAQTFSKRSQEMEDRSKKFSSTFETNMTSAVTKVNGVIGKLGLGGIAAGGIAGIVASVKGIADAVAEVGDQAKMAGLSTKVFQEWKYVAEQARIPVDAITDGLKELQIRADEFAVTGKGSAAEAFARLGLTPQEVKEKLKDPSDLMLLLIERTRQLKDTSAGVRIFDELFGGTGGERMVSLIEQGEAGIRRQIQAANDFGHVLSDDVIQKAAEIDRQFNAIAGTVGTTLKSAIVSVVSSMVDFLDGLRAVESQRDSTIQKSINDIMRQKQETAQAIAAIDAEDSKLSERQKARARGTHLEKMRQLEVEENKRIAELENRPSVMSFSPKASGAWTPPAYTPPAATPTAGDKTREKAAREIERERAAVGDLIAELRAELDMVGKTAVQKEKMTAIRQAGNTATAEEQIQILALIDAIDAKTLADERATEAAREARDAARDFAGTVVDGFIQGAKATDILSNALKNLGSRLANSALDSLFGMGGGGIFGLVGGLFGGGGKFPAAPGGLYADGGYTGAGGKWDPAGTVHKGEVVFSQADVARNGGVAATEALRMNGAPAIAAPATPALSQRAGSSSTSVSVPIHIDATGADAAGLARVERQLNRMREELPGTIVKTVQSAQGRRSL